MAGARETNVALLLEIERLVRRAESLTALGFVMVNESRRLLPCTRAAFFISRGRKRFRLAALSDLPDVDRTTPFAVFAEALTREHFSGNGPSIMSQGKVAGRWASQWRDLAPPEAVIIPLTDLRKGATGALALFRDHPFSESELVLLEHLGEVYGYAMQAVDGGRRGLAFSFKPRAPFLGAIFILLLSGLLPVRMSALAPVEVVPDDPWVVTSPMDGVVRDILVKTNDRVLPGQVVAELDDTDVRNRVAVAEQSVLLASVVLDKGERTMFQDSLGKGRVAEFRAALKLRNTELAYAREILDKTRLSADREGIAVVGDPIEWQGRPVTLGQRILMIADPDKVEFRIMLPVSDAVTLEAGSPVRVFLDSDPLTPLEGEVVRWEYEPRLTPAGVLAYYVTAGLRCESKPRIGLRGTAKVHGPRVSLFYFLFRRPLTAMRQRLGV